MLAKFQRSVMALAQPADVQVSLFPDFVCKADELALDFEEGLGELKGQSEEITGEQQAAIEALDQIILEMSGEKNASFWTEDALRTHPIWEEIRSAAKATLASFGWELRRPPPSDAIYIGADS